MSERAAALVIGASVGGLTAAAYLTRAGLHTLLLEAGQVDVPKSSLLLPFLGLPSSADSSSLS